MKKPVKSLPDTNTIVRYLVKDDIVLYKEADNFFKKVKIGEAKAIILESVIAECIYVLTKIYKVTKEKAAGSLIDLLHYKGIINDDQNELIEALTVFAGSPPLDIVDCILCAKAKRYDMELFTFDERLRKRGAL